MKISDEREHALFKAISDPITEHRIKAMKQPLTEQDLFGLDLVIWRRIRQVLNIN